MDDAGQEALRDAIQHLHGLRSEWIESVSVRETFKGELVWEGEVQVFGIQHPQATRCYAWSHESGPGGRRKFFAVLGIPPVDSATDAVRASIASGQAT
jgi:hypothetical protein